MGNQLQAPPIGETGQSMVSESQNEEKEVERESEGLDQKRQQLRRNDSHNA